MASEIYSIRLDPQRRAQLQQIADKQDRDLAYIIRKAIDEYISEHSEDEE